MLSLAILSFIIAILISLQKNTLDQAKYMLDYNSEEQYLNAIEQRLKLYIWDAEEIDLQVNPLRLRVVRRFSYGRREYLYYLDQVKHVFYESAQYLEWYGDGAKPGSYITPIASEIKKFSVELEYLPKGIMLNIHISSSLNYKKFSILARNTLP